MVAQGYPNKAIATELDVSHFTVSSYLRRIFAKLKVRSRSEMVAKLAAADDPSVTGYQPLWTQVQVRDVATDLHRSLVDDQGVCVSGDEILRALAAAGIEPGAVR